MRRTNAPGLALAAALMASFCVVACSKPQQAPAGGPAPVGVVVMKAEPVNLTTELTGRTSAFEVSEVRPQVNGVVRARLFSEGGLVSKGQPLYQIDAATYRATLQSAQAGLSQAQAALTSARLKAERYRGLVAINAISKQDNDDAQAAYRQAAANVQAQQATVEQGRIGVEYTRVLSPISGRIGKSSVTPGALVTANQVEPLTTVQNLEKIYVDLTQSAPELMKLRRDMASGEVGKPASAAVTLILDDGTIYPVQGRLEFSDVSVDPGTGSVTIRAVFPNSDGALLPGLFVRARLTKAVASDGIMVPQAAVSRDPKGGATVLVVGAGSKVEPRSVVLGQSIGDKWLALSGLKPGDQVIVDNLQKIQPGMPVKAQAQTAPASPAPAAKR